MCVCVWTLQLTLSWGGKKANSLYCVKPVLLQLVVGFSGYLHVLSMQSFHDPDVCMVEWNKESDWDEFTVVLDTDVNAPKQI